MGEQSLKFKNFILKNYGYFAVAAFVFAVYFAAEAAFGVFPFGSSVMAAYDQLAQVCPAIEHYFDFFSGESGLFHTFHLGLGSDLFGLLTYSTLSPFTFIFLLGGKGNAVYAVSFVLPLKSACAAVSMFRFLKNRFRNLPQWGAVVLSALYAFSGYLYVANTFIVWLDIMIYAPLCLSGYGKLINEKRITLFVVSLTLCIYACFSLACFSFFTLFPIFVLYPVFCVKNEDRKDVVSRVVISFAAAIFFAMPILLPALKATLSSARNTGLFSRVFSVLGEKSYKEGGASVHLYEKFSYIFSDAFLLCLVVVYFIKSKRKSRRARFMLVAFLYLIIPCVIDESMLLLNMGSYYSYALRFGFIISAYLTYVAALAANGEFSSAADNAASDTKNSCVAITVTGILTALGIFAAIYLFWFISSGAYKSSALVSAVQRATGSKEKPFTGFFSSFAHSRGGMEGVLILFITAIIVFAVLALFVGMKKIKVKTVAPFLCVLALSQSIFYCFSMVAGNVSATAQPKLAAFTEINSMLKERDDEIFRLKTYKEYVSSDSPLITGVYSDTLFNSIADKKNFTAVQKFRYDNNGTNSTKSTGGSILSDSLLGYKYVVYSSSDVSRASGRPNLRNTGISYGGYVVYENIYSVPQCAVIDVEDNDLINADDFSAFTDCLIRSLGGDGVEFLDLSPMKSGDGYEIYFDSPENGETFFTTFFPSDWQMSGDIGNHYFGYSAGSPSSSVTIKRDNGVLTEEDVRDYCRAYFVSENSLAKLKTAANEKAVGYRLRKNGFEIDGFTAKGGQYLYLGYVNLDGYEISVNGRRVAAEENSLDMIFIPLTDGENKVEIKYKSPYIPLIFIGMAVGFCLLAVLWFIYKKKPLVFAVSTKGISLAAYAVVFAVTMFFFVFPTGIACWKFFFKYIGYLI